MAHPLERDLDEVLDLTEGLWQDLQGARILVTGGTGFMGCWLLESLLHANRRLGMDLRAVVLTRDPDGFRRKAPELAEASAIQLVHGDVLRLPELPGECSHVIHAATEASAQLLRTDPLKMFDTIVLGTRNVLEWAAAKGVQRALFTSSGAVYGRQPPELARIPDSWLGAPDCANPASAYAEGKRAAESLCALFASQGRMAVAIARCFAFVGPYLPLDAHFAIGNFLRDALQGGPVVVGGDGTPLRSYLYTSDLTAWLWHLLLRGPSAQPVNVGSEEAVSIGGLAERVAQTLGPLSWKVLGTPVPDAVPERYVPGTARARELGLRQTVGLEEAILRTAAWHRSRLPLRE